MAVTFVLRASAGSEKHVATLKNTDNYLIHYALDGDRADFGGSATGTVFNAATAGVIGTFLDCTDKQSMLFKIEYSTSGTRRFRVVFKDFNATIGYVIPATVYQPENTGLVNATLGILKSTYQHATGIVVSCIGFKEATLQLIDDGLTSPAVSAWGIAV